MNDYDVKQSIQRIEDDLIESMIRNMQRHKVQEVEENKQWTMWQAEQLRSLDAYKKRNQKKYGKEFGKINDSIPNIIAESRRLGNMDQETELLEAMSKGWKPTKGQGDLSGTFFRMNDQKMDALINSTVNDMQKAETAILRRADDAYRKVIFDSQVYAASGAGTYEKAVDMATKDFLSAGIQCVQYKNGAMHTLSDYADMAIRTATKRAYLTGEGEKRQEWGCHLVIVTKRGNPCPKCLPFCGKVLIDDVWSGGSSKDGSYPLMSSAIEAGLYHPRCKDSHTTYFSGISGPPDSKYTKKEIEEVKEVNKKEARQQYSNRQEEKFSRLAMYSLDNENQWLYRKKEDAWRDVQRKTGNMSEDEYALAKETWTRYNEVEMPQHEREHIYEEFDNNLTAEEKSLAIVRRPIGDYHYTAINKGHNQYKIIDRRLIEEPEDVVNSVLTEMFGEDWSKL